MADQYTPTTEDVTTAALAGGIYSESEFDRWLAAHEAEVRERVAQDIEASVLPNDDSPTAHWLRSRAANIARGATR